MAPPSFSSFPPSFSSFPDQESGPSSRLPSHRREDPKRHKESKKDKEEKEKRKRERHKSESKRVDVSAIHGKGEGWTSERVFEDGLIKAEEDKKLRGRQDGMESLPPYYSDRKGDPLNISYGGLHAGDVPKYHLVDRGRKVLGLGTAWTAHRGGGGIEITVGSRRRIPTLTDSKSRALLAVPPKRRLISSANPNKYEDADGFLRLPSDRRKQDDQSYKSITLDKDVDSDLQASTSESEAYDSSDDDSGPQLSSHELRTKELEEEIIADPSSIMAWLSLIAHSLSTIPVTSKNSTTTRAEITLSILSRALSHPNNSTSKVLRIRYLKAGEEVWHESKLKAEWEGALKIGGIEIWMEWLGWRIRQGLGGIDNIVGDAVRVLRTLGDREDDEISALRVFWHTAVALEQAGFHERANALFQAQAELSFHAPRLLVRKPLHTQVEALEEFWESEVPRIGEPDAKGWASWIGTNHTQSTLLANPNDFMSVDSEYADPYQQWYHTESTSDRTMRMPARSSDSRSETDPYSAVLLFDMGPLLLLLNSPHSKRIFRLIWLSFLGLHIPGFVASLFLGSWDDRWSFTHLVAPHSLLSIFPSRDLHRSLLANAYNGVLIGQEREYRNAFGPVKEWHMRDLGPLEWVGKEQWRMWTAEDVQKVDCGSVRLIFEQLRFGPEDYEWDIYTLAFEAAINLKDATKLSRSFLSVARDSLPHWAAHARLERLRRRSNDARKVYQTALAGPSLDQTDPFVGQLWWDWVEMEWMEGDETSTLQVISQSVGLQGFNHVTILRAKRNLDDVVKANFNLPKDKQAWVKVRAMVELLTSSPIGTLAVFDSCPCGSTGVEDGFREGLMVSSLVMIYNHTMILRKPCPPSILRERLQVAVDAFPSNTIILGMFLEIEKGQGVWGRVKGLLGQNKVYEGEKGVASRVAEVWIASWEKGRWEGEIERTRNGLAAAAECERTRGSPIIWRIILELEIQAGQLQRAKSLLYRAIGECPFLKELYLLAFGPLRSVFAPHELKSFGDTMAERGLRMRVGLDEFLDGREVTVGEAESGASDDEIEEAANERRRLMPY